MATLKQAAAQNAFVVAIYAVFKQRKPQSYCGTGVKKVRAWTIHIGRITIHLEDDPAFRSVKQKQPLA